MDNDLREKINTQLRELDCMSEFAAELAIQLDGDGAKPGFFQIEMGAGERLAFCCIDIKRRIDELRDTHALALADDRDFPNGDAS